MKSEAPYDDDNLHFLEIEICGHSHHKSVTPDGGLQKYFFAIPFNGCEKGLTSYLNLDDGWDWCGSDYSNNQMDMEISVRVDGQAIADLANPIILELEFSYY